MQALARPSLERVEELPFAAVAVVVRQILFAVVWLQILQIPLWY